MKKLLIIFGVAAIIFGCKTQKGPDEVKAELSKLKTKSIEIGHQIKELEKKLVQMESEEESSSNVPVKVKQLDETRFEHYFVVNAKVELTEEAQISPEGSGGQIKKIHVQKGQRVAKGDLLVSLNSTVLENSIAELKLGLNLTTKIYEKQKSLWEQNIGSELQYLEAKNGKESMEHKLKTLQAQLDMASIKAPFSGIVDDIFLKEGEIASPGRSILYLVNLESLKIVSDVSESMLPKINIGEMVQVRFPSYPEISLKAPIHRIGNAIDMKTRTIKVELKIDNVGGKIKPNQIAILNIKDFEAEKAIVVPSIIVKQDSKGEFLFTINSNETGSKVAQKVYIKTGLSYNDQTMVVSGLSLGQQIVTAGFNQISNGSLVSIKE